MKPGDKIRCINPNGNYGLELNHYYTVCAVGEHKFRNMISVNELPHKKFMFMRRFVLVGSIAGNSVPTYTPAPFHRGDIVESLFDDHYHNIYRGMQFEVHACNETYVEIKVSTHGPKHLYIAPVDRFALVHQLGSGAVPNHSHGGAVAPGTPVKSYGRTFKVNYQDLINEAAPNAKEIDQLIAEAEGRKHKCTCDFVSVILKSGCQCGGV